MTTSWMLSAGTAAAASALRIAAAPSAVALTGANTPWKLPIGVRLALRMTIES